MAIKDLFKYYVQGDNGSYSSIKARSKSEAVKECKRLAKDQLIKEESVMIKLRYERKKELKAFFWKKSSVAMYQKEIDETKKTINALKAFLKTKDFYVLKEK